MVRVRSKTVEPVIGTLVNFTNMKRINIRGIKSANKHVLMASLTYNLKKYLKFIIKKPTIQVQKMQLEVRKTQALLKTYFHEVKTRFLRDAIFGKQNLMLKINHH